MSEDWQTFLSRWISAGLVDVQTADSIRAWEKEQGDETGRNRFAVIASGLGGLLLIAGVLLFVASNWEQLSPVGRFFLLTASVAVFHAGGAYAGQSRRALSTTLHAVGTGALGGAIFLSGQTFHLAENWPEGFLLWAIGAAAGLYLLRDWTHVLYTAVLGPIWLWTEIAKLAMFDKSGDIFHPAASFSVLLALAYLSSTTETQRSIWRKSLSRLGALALIPTAIAAAVSGSDSVRLNGSDDAGPVVVAAWILALVAPSGLAYLLRRKDAFYFAIAIAWVLAIGRLDAGNDIQFLLLMALFAAGSVGIVLWGLRDHYPLSINLGVVGFALSVIVFYFASDIFTKLGRSVGLIGAGLLFIGGERSPPGGPLAPLSLVSRRTAN